MLLIGDGTMEGHVPSFCNHTFLEYLYVRIFMIITSEKVYLCNFYLAPHFKNGYKFKNSYCDDLVVLQLRRTRNVPSM